jgi:rod shape-determining protein MreC
MRNIFLFIRRYFVFLAFLVLQGFALWMLFKYNRVHRAVFLGAASEVTGSINSQVDKVDDYFHLQEENKRVHRMNDSLMNLLRSNFNVPDTSQKIVTDSLRIDSTTTYRRYIYRAAKVVYNSVNADKNYIQINRGSNQGVKDNMAVVSSDGSVVGVVVSVSPNFAQVMSLLHVQSSVSASLKNSNITGKVEWDAIDPRFVLLRGIPKDIKVNKGDTVLTSQYSFNFPPYFMIGTVANVGTDPSSGFYLLKVRTSVSFNSLQQVFVVENLQREEQLKLDEDTKTKMEQEKKGKQK